MIDLEGENLNNAIGISFTIDQSLKSFNRFANTLDLDLCKICTQSRMNQQ